jgi:hypothetical protein
MRKSVRINNDKPQFTRVWAYVDDEQADEPPRDSVPHVLGHRCAWCCGAGRGTDRTAVFGELCCGAAQVVTVIGI